jgi:hypothetical protein
VDNRHSVLVAMLEWSLHALCIIAMAIEIELEAWKRMEPEAASNERARFEAGDFGRLVQLAHWLDEWRFDLGLPFQLKQLHTDLLAFAQRAGSNLK